MQNFKVNGHEILARLIKKGLEMEDSPHENPVLDPSQLAVMTGDDPSLAVEVIDIFRQQTDIWVRMLDADLPPAQWADAAHSLKGSALSVGAMRLADVCAKAEKLGRSAEEKPISRTEAAICLSDVKDQIGPAIEASAKLAHQLSLSGSFSLS